MINVQVIRFIGVGIINTLFYYMLYSLFIFSGFDYKAAVLVATVIGVFFSFKMFGRFVFKRDENHLIIKFIFVYCVLYLLNVVLIKEINIHLNNYYLSGFIAALICAFFSFILNKFVVFR